MDIGIARQGDIVFQANLYGDPNATRRGLHLKRRRWVEGALAKHLRLSATVLEVGIGCGVFTRFLVDNKTRVTAVDINADFVAAVRNLPKVTALVADATDPLPVPPHDLVLCSEVLEHVPPSRSRALLRSLHDALTPGGRVILTTPQRYATVEMMARLLRFPPILALARRLYGTADELGHVNLLTEAILRRQIAEAGFVIEEQARFGFYLPLIAEFGGSAGWKLLCLLERLIAKTPCLKGLIWTQAYVLIRN